MDKDGYHGYHGCAYICREQAVIFGADDKDTEVESWVSLTDEEVDELYTSVQLEVNDHWDKGGTTMMFPLTLYKAIEAKLKERNA